MDVAADLGQFRGCVVGHLSFVVDEAVGFTEHNRFHHDAVGEGA